jgi:hypothetical protein
MLLLVWFHLQEGEVQHLGRNSTDHAGNVQLIESATT